MELMETVMISIITGIISGIISSVLVTVYYRKRDNRVNKKRLFLNIQRALYEFSEDIFPLNHEMDPEYFKGLQEKYTSDARFECFSDGIDMSLEESNFVENYKELYTSCKLLIWEINLCAIRRRNPNVCEEERNEANKLFVEDVKELDEFWRETSDLFNEINELIKKM